jgi:predicted nucleic acid-binding protein
MDLVVDASVAVMWFVPEPHSMKAKEILARDGALHAPDLFRAEVVGVLCRKIQIEELKADEGREALNAFMQLPVQFHATADLLVPAFEIALESRQYVDDCVYLILAAQLNIRMVTADRRFYKAIQKTEFKNHIGWIEDALTAGVSDE